MAWFEVDEEIVYLVVSRYLVMSPLRKVIMVVMGYVGLCRRSVSVLEEEGPERLQPPRTMSMPAYLRARTGI